MKFIVDAMLPDELVLRLREQGVEARHVRFLRETGLNDESVWSHACKNGDVVISKDADFLALSAVDDRAKLVFVTIGNTSRKVMVERIMLRYGDIDEFAHNTDRILYL